MMRKIIKYNEFDSSDDSSSRNSTPPRKCKAIPVNMTGIQNMILETANLVKNIKKEFNEKVGIVKEEKKSQEMMDDDEDYRKPQYIPNTTFYHPEHNDTYSTAAESRETKEKQNKIKRENNNMTDKWLHDKYNDKEQAPKSCAELIAEYGYDIRKKKVPPRAYKRTYDWGPNNYTRNWEDEDPHRKKKDKTERASKNCAQVMEEYGYNIREREGPSRAH